MIYQKDIQIKKWIILYFTSKNNNSILFRYLTIDILEEFKHIFRYVKLPNNYFIKISLGSNLDTKLSEELDYYTIFIHSRNNTNGKYDNDRYINRKLQNVCGKYGKNMISNYNKNKLDDRLDILVPENNSYLLTIRDFDINNTRKGELINNMEIIYQIYDNNQNPYLYLWYPLNSKSDKYLKPDGIYRLEYNTKPKYSKIDLEAIYFTIPKDYITLY